MLTMLVVALVTSGASAQTSPVVSDAITVLVRSGREADALAALAALPAPDREHAEVHYLEARLLERLARHAEAAAAFASVDGAPPRVARDAIFRRGRALLRAGDPAGAETVLASVPASDATTRALIAECALASGDYPRAITLLTRVVAEAPRTVDTFAARFELAEAQLRSGDRDAAIATLRELAIVRPEHPDAASALATLVELDPTAALTVSEHLDRAERLIAAHRAQDAVVELDAVERPTDEALLARFLHVRGMALFETRARYAEAAVALTEAAAAEGAPSRAADEFHAARALLRAGGHDEEAIRQLRAFVRTHGTDTMATEAEYVAAQSELRAGGAHRGRAMQRFLDGPRGRRVGDFVREARFSLALVALDARDASDAARRLEVYRGGVTRDLDRNRADYWRARALELGGDARGAKALYRTLVRAEPLGWYALFARQHLVALGEPEPSPLPDVAIPDEPAPIFELPIDARFYRSIGLDRDAAAELARTPADLHRAAGTHALSAAYLSLFDFHRAYGAGAMSSMLSHPPSGAATWAWDASYPRAFEPAVREASRIARIEPELVWSVMRQESAFDAEVVSYADAIGLMQLMPATAAAVAARTSSSFSRDVLYDPTWNVRFGAAYLAELNRAYGVPLCFAAYNAGEHRVDEWLTRGEMDLDRFVEEIPFSQTRGYVRRVTASLAHYRFRESPDDWPVIDMPDRVGHAVD
jgi:soluble lytic murein transglycosylase